MRGSARELVHKERQEPEKEEDDDDDDDDENNNDDDNSEGKEKKNRIAAVPNISAIRKTQKYCFVP